MKSKVHYLTQAPTLQCQFVRLHMVFDDKQDFLQVTHCRFDRGHTGKHACERYGTGGYWAIPPVLIVEQS